MATCKSFLEDIDTCIKSTLDTLDEIKQSDSSLGEEIAKPFTYCCIYKSSNNGSLSRDDIFKLVGAFLQSKNKSNKVDFDKPNFVLVINVICNICYLSFVKNYFEYKRYNLVEHGAKFNANIPAKSIPNNAGQVKNGQDLEKSDDETSEDEKEDETNNDNSQITTTQIE